MWLASDRVGHVAAFVTAGEGPIPAQVLEDGRIPVDELEERVHALPRSSRARLLVDVKRPDSFMAMAERGLYVYDWRDAHRASREAMGGYEPVAVPVRPVRLDAIGDELAASISGISLDVKFSDGGALDVAEQLPCRRRE